MTTTTRKETQKETWAECLGHELRAVAEAKAANQTHDQQQATARARALNAGIHTWWAVLTEQWNESAHAVRGAGRVGHVIVVNEPLGRLEILETRGSATLWLESDGWVKVTTLVTGSGRTYYVQLTPGEAGIAPAPADLVRQTLEPFFTAIGRDPA